MKERTVRIHDLTGLLNALYPPALAESWDNAGLQVGDPSAPVRGVLVCLDPSEKALEAAAALSVQALISHHPLIFSPLRTVAPTDETGRVLFGAVRAGIAVLSAHTNLDRGENGLNDWLAERLGIEGGQPLVLGEPDLVKLVVYAPAGYEDAVAEALFRGGAGQIGNYDGCSFRTRGTGTFRPGSGATPFVGEVGRTERVDEIRLETILPRDRIGRVVERMKKAHPYEEPAHDLIPLGNRRGDVGLGRIGKLPASLSLDAFAARVKTSLGSPSVRVVGDGTRQVRKVAVCGGSGASVLGEALRQGADVLVTGDLKYHEARRAESEGIAVVDAGHFATERLMVPHLAAALRRGAEERRMEIEFIEMEGESDPFRGI